MGDYGGFYSLKVLLNGRCHGHSIYDIGESVKSPLAALRTSGVLAELPESFVRPYGSSVRPYESPVQPYGSSVKLYGSSVKPYGSSVKPYGSSVQPYGSSVQPYGSSVQPYGNSLKPYGSSVRPRGGFAVALNKPEGFGIIYVWKKNG
jgi:hypothetical protein